MRVKFRERDSRRCPPIDPPLLDPSPRCNPPRRKSTEQIWQYGDKAHNNHEQSDLDIHARNGKGTEKSLGWFPEPKGKALDAETNTITVSYRHDSRDSP